MAKLTATTVSGGIEGKSRRHNSLKFTQIVIENCTAQRNPICSRVNVNCQTHPRAVGHNNSQLCTKRTTTGRSSLYTEQTGKTNGHADKCLEAIW